MLDGEDGVVDQRGDVGPRGQVLEVLPACLGRHPEDPLGGVLVAALQQAFDLRPADAFGFQFPLELAAPRLKGVGNVLQEEQAEDDVLVLGGVDLTAQGVGRFPEDFGVGQVGGGYAIVRHSGISPLFFGGQAPCHGGRCMYHGDCCILTKLRQNRLGVDPATTRQSQPASPCSCATCATQTSPYRLKASRPRPGWPLSDGTR